MTTASSDAPGRPSAPAGIHHFAIRVHDLAAAERFYCGVLGLSVRTRWPAVGPAEGVGRGGAGGSGEGAPERSLWLDLGDEAGGFVALERAEPHARAAVTPQDGDVPPGGHHLVALRIDVSSRAAWEAHLAAAGVAVSHRSAFTLYFCDPEGNRLGLSHHPHPAASGAATSRSGASADATLSPTDSASR